MIPSTLFRRRKGACSIAEMNGSHFSLQGITHAHWSLVSLDIRRIMHENQYRTFRMFPYEPFHENMLPEHTAEFFCFYFEHFYTKSELVSK